MLVICKPRCRAGDGSWNRRSCAQSGVEELFQPLDFGTSQPWPPSGVDDTHASNAIIYRFYEVLGAQAATIRLRFGPLCSCRKSAAKHKGLAFRTFRQHVFEALWISIQPQNQHISISAEASSRWMCRGEVPYGRVRLYITNQDKPRHQIPLCGVLFKSWKVMCLFLAQKNYCGRCEEWMDWRRWGLYRQRRRGEEGVRKGMEAHDTR